MELDKAPSEDIDGCKVGSEVVYTSITGQKYRAMVRNVRNVEAGVVDLSVYVSGQPFRFYLIDHDLRGAFHTWRKG